MLREAFFGVRRFDQIQSNLGIARNILTDRLRRLEAEGVLERRPEERFNYRLTQKGIELYPILLALLHWGDNWTAGPAGPPLLLYHKICGHRISPIITCTHCGQEVQARDVWYEYGPGAIHSAEQNTPLPQDNSGSGTKRYEESIDPPL